MCLSALYFVMLPFLLIYHLLFKNITVLICDPADHTQQCFSTLVAAQKSGLDGAGTPWDLRKFGKGAV